MAFIETPRFPDSISYGSKGGPKFNTIITTVNSGYEYNNINWDQARHSYDVAMGVRSLSELSQLVSFFQITRGKGHYFRYKDWADYKSCDIDDTVDDEDQVFGIGDAVSTEFQLIKTYDLNGGVVNQRDIKKPVYQTIVIAINGTPQIEDTYTGTFPNLVSTTNNNYWIDYTTGIVTFNSAPASSASITWGGEFDVPCRFDTDELQLSMDFYGYGSTGVPVIEVRV